MMFNPHKLPQSVDDAVDILLSDLSLNSEIHMAAMKEEDIAGLHFSLGSAIRNEFGLWTGNEALMESCRKTSGDPHLHIDDASMVIIKALWKRIKSSNILNREDWHGRQT
ncbi:hypothetical protein D4S03_09090 [bacterium]|nr:MAG: hypothetical protein D4S03_09090 [bacterium]